MSKKNKGGLKRNEMYFALKEIRSKYKIDNSDIVFFAPVYYPIAILEINLDEVSFEDFEAVQLAVLRFYSLGIKDYNMIADLMGLSPNYVYRLLNLLRGYGHIDEAGITELGQKSLEVEKKITKAQVWQKFQVDALNGTLLKMSETVSDNVLNDKGDTSFIVGHLDYIDGISVDLIRMQIAGEDYKDYIKRDSDILSTNLLAINDVKCTDILYAKSFILGLKSAIEPLIFAKRYDSKKEKLSERFTWLPFSVGDESIKARYGIEDQVGLSTETSSQYANAVLGLINDRAANLNLEEEVPKVLQRTYPFNLDEVELVQSFNPVIVNINERSFTSFRKWILNFLMDLVEDGESLVSNEYLYGNIIKLRSKSDKLFKTANILKGKIAEKGSRSKVFNRLNDELKDFQPREGLDLIDMIHKTLTGEKDEDVN